MLPWVQEDLSNNVNDMNGQLLKDLEKDIFEKSGT